MTGLMMWRIEDERQGGAGETSDRQRKQKKKKTQEKKNAQERESVKDQECEESQKK